MTAFPMPHNEAERLCALHDLHILDTAPAPEFDAVVKLACDLFDVPVALVSFVDADRQWFKARHNLAAQGTDRAVAFCNYPVTTGEVLVVPDALLDPRFAQNVLVTGAPFIRFYAGVPLALEPGLHLGTLCLIDYAPRSFSGDDQRKLVELGAVVAGLLRQHRDALAAARLTQELHLEISVKTERDLQLTRYQKIFDSASSVARIGAWERRIGSDDTVWTAGMYAIHEIPVGTPLTRSRIYAAYSPLDRRRIAKLVDQTCRTGRGFSFDGQITTETGMRRWVRLTGEVEMEQGVPVRIFGIKQDITEERATSERVRQLAELDPLTGLYNRNAWNERLNAFQGVAAILFLDVDGFKSINDTFGHWVGDECLKHIAKRLRSVLGKRNFVARLGGDEFAVLFGAISRATMEDLAQRILVALRRPVRLRGISYQISGSVGIAFRDQLDADHPDRLVIAADLALYAAKAAGRDTYRLFDPGMQDATDRRNMMIRQMNLALSKKELRLFYQPKINLVDGSLAGFEALLRWRRPDGRIVTAGEFFEAFSDPRLSAKIGDWVMDAALQQAADWTRAGLHFGHIAINVSQSQFHETDFATRLLGGLQAHGLDPSVLEIEVTEGVMLSHAPGPVLVTINKMRAAGLRISLDDFGTGYASLVHLKTFPVDTIKIDRTFVRDFLGSNADNAILQATLLLARQLSLEVVAEGIETEDQLIALRALGCDVGQGFLFSKAMPAHDAARFCSPGVRRVCWNRGRGLKRPKLQMVAS